MLSTTSQTLAQSPPLFFVGRNHSPSRNHNLLADEDEHATDTPRKKSACRCDSLPKGSCRCYSLSRQYNPADAPSRHQRLLPASAAAREAYIFRWRKREAHAKSKSCFGQSPLGLYLPPTSTRRTPKLLFSQDGGLSHLIRTNGRQTHNQALQGHIPRPAKVGDKGNANAHCNGKDRHNTPHQTDSFGDFGQPDNNRQDYCFFQHCFSRFRF